MSTVSNKLYCLLYGIKYKYSRTYAGNYFPTYWLRQQSDNCKKWQNFEHPECHLKSNSHLHNHWQTANWVELVFVLVCVYCLGPNVVAGKCLHFSMLIDFGNSQNWGNSLLHPVGVIVHAAKSSQMAYTTKVRRNKIQNHIIKFLTVSV